MFDRLDIPENAIQSFETLSGLSVAVHDLAGTLWPILPPGRFNHMTPVCQAVKALGHLPACMDFDVQQVRDQLIDQPRGRIHVCHAGLVEWVVPVFDSDQLQWILFAGQRTVGPGLHEVLAGSPRRAPNWARRLTQPAPIDAADARVLLEALEQLAARLQRWRDEIGSAMPVAAHQPDDRTRAAQIRQFILYHHREPVTLADIARTLHLSESRTAHVVRQVCGQSFVTLLNEARVRSAAGLLRHSNLSLMEIAERSGFSDLSNFHRRFRSVMGTTPHRYRHTDKA